MIINVPGDYPSVQAAMDAAGPGDEVVLAAGTYREQNLKFHGKAITVRSAGPEDTSAVDTTIVRGDGTAPVFNIYSGEQNDSVIRGLTITSDEAEEPYLFGGGIDLFEASPTIEYCHITGNRAQYGGGLCSYRSSARIRHNRITGNTGTLVGGGIHASDSALEIEDNEICENLGSLYGGGLHVLNVEAGIALRRNVLHLNKATLGAGLYIAGSATSEVVNNVICHNLEYRPTECGLPMGGGVYCNNYAGHMVNNTISHNGAEIGGNLLVRGEITPEVRNCIISFASKGGGVCAYQSNVKLHYCDVFGNVAGDIENLDGGITMTGQKSEDPLFHDAGNDDFHLESRAGRWDPGSDGWVSDAASSPCIDAGDPASDFSQEPMGHGFRVNMGAYGNTGQASKSIMRLVHVLHHLAEHYLHKLTPFVYRGGGET